MLEHVTGAQAVCATSSPSISTVDSDAVVAGSHLIKDPGRRNTLPSACRRHVRDGGTVLVERFAPGRLLTAALTVGQSGPSRSNMNRSAATATSSRREPPTDSPGGNGCRTGKPKMSMT